MAEGENTFAVATPLLGLTDMSPRCLQCFLYPGWTVEADSEVHVLFTSPLMGTHAWRMGERRGQESGAQCPCLCSS